MFNRATDRAILSLPIGLRRRASYLRAHHRWLSLKHPVRYTEKLNWRMVFDRRELMVTACDKLAMKQYASERVGPRVRTPQTIWSGTDVRELASIALPQHWVLKPNSGTGRVYFGTGRPAVATVESVVAGWLDDRGLERWGEWGYGRARRMLIVEEQINGRDQSELVDWKFFVFAGRPLLVQVDTGRFTNHQRRLYTPQWHPLPHICELPLAPAIKAPPQLATMLELAADIGELFDHIRVDLYLYDNQIWFSELTPYSGSGVVRFEPDDLDFFLGNAWQLPSGNVDGGTRTPLAACE